MWVVCDYDKIDGDGSWTSEVISVMHLPIRCCSIVNVVLLVRKLLQWWGGLCACTFCLLVLSGSPGAPHKELAYTFLTPFGIFFSGLSIASHLHPRVPWSFLPQDSICSKMWVSHMRSDHLLGFLEILLLWWRPSLADARGQSDLLPVSPPHLLMFFSWTSHLSFLICKMERAHVKCLAQCLTIHRLLPLLSSHFFAAHGSLSLIMPSSIWTS